MCSYLMRYCSAKRSTISEINRLAEILLDKTSRAKRNCSGGERCWSAGGGPVFCARNGAAGCIGRTRSSDCALSLCVGPSPLCTAENQGITEMETVFCIASDTNYSLTGSVQASANEDIGNITATGVVSIETVGPSPMFIVNEQATNGQDVPISMSLPLTAVCYDMIVEVYADALPNGTGAGSASSSCNVLLSPQ